jgi:hypothetical protein
MKQPLLIKQGDNIQEKIRKIPNIHTQSPAGFKLIQIYFVDSSGFGQEGESALTFPQFVSKVKIGKYYAIVDAGQFQVNIGEFEKK